MKDISGEKYKYLMNQDKETKIEKESLFMGGDTQQHENERCFQIFYTSDAFPIKLPIMSFTEFQLLNKGLHEETRT